MTMFTFNYAILMMGMGTCKPMSNAKGIEIFGEMSKFTSSITLNNFNFAVELKFNHGFELDKLSECVRFKSQREDPNKSGKSIYTGQKIGVTT